MEQRINAYEKGHSAMQALYGLGVYLTKSPIEQSLVELIDLTLAVITINSYNRINIALRNWNGSRK